MTTTRTLAVQDVWNVLDIVYGELGDLPNHYLPEELLENEEATLECGRTVFCEGSIWKAMPDRVTPSQEEVARLEQTLDPLAWGEIHLLSKGVSQKTLRRVLHQALDVCGH